MLKNEMESYVRIGGRGLKNLTYPYRGVGRAKNCQNYPYVINEWPLKSKVDTIGNEQTTVPFISQPLNKWIEKML